MPVTHWAGRITVMAVLAALIAGFAFSGAAAGVARWSGHCGVSVIHRLWSPLLDDRTAG